MAASKERNKNIHDNLDEAMVEYYRVLATQINPLPLEPQLSSDFYRPSEGQKNTHYKYLKKMTFEKLYEVYYQPDPL